MRAMRRPMTVVGAMIAGCATGCGSSSFDPVGEWTMEVDGSDYPVMIAVAPDRWCGFGEGDPFKWFLVETGFGPGLGQVCAKTLDEERLLVLEDLGPSDRGLCLTLGCVLWVKPPSLKEERGHLVGAGVLHGPGSSDTKSVRVDLRRR